MKLIALLLVTTLGFAGSAIADEKEAKAREAALLWLSQLDSEQYKNTWKNAASVFKKQVSSRQWKKAASGVRKPLGPVKSRELINETYTTNLPGAPDGEYVIFQFQTEFENKSIAIETITPMLDGEEWRVSGYFVN